MKYTIKSALQFAGIGLFAATSLLAPGSTESATAIDDLVDCTDSFWMVACDLAEAETRTPIVIPQGETRIDNDMVCTVDTAEVLICHT